MAKRDAKGKAAGTAAEEPFDFGEALLEGLREAAAWKRGEIALETRIVQPMSPERVRSIRKRVAPSVKAFERRFRIPASTVTNWEQGRRAPDPAARLLLKLIERNPEEAERAARELAESEG